MDAMFESLVSKTLFIVGSQILITYAATVLLIRHFRNLYLAHSPLVAATKNEAGELDLEISWEAIKGPFYALLAVDVVTFLALMFYGVSHPGIGYGIFSFWSVLTGFELALVLLSIDENLGAKALRLTALTTMGAALVGMYSGISFASLGGFLFIGLTLLILFDFARLLFSFSNRTQLVGAIFGAVLFVFYLIFDFDRLESMQKSGWDNSWSRALDVSVSIYLDIINLFLRILEILSRSNHK
jgi:FtsH-binding integral membrane protein